MHAAAWAARAATGFHQPVPANHLPLFGRFQDLDEFGFALQMHMIFRHKLKSAEISTLVNSRLPILVVIGSQDKLMRPRHQRKAARALQARSMEVKSAHWLASQTVPIADAVVSVAYSPPLGPEKDPKSVDKLGSPDLRPGE